MAITISRRGEQIKAFNFEQITVAATAVGFTAATITPATGNSAVRALVTVETAQIRFTYDGTTPTTTVGHVLNAGDTLELEGVTNVSTFKAIRTGATSATISCTYERHPS